MNTYFAMLCDLLDDEAERQETMRSVLESQRAALERRDTEHLEAKSEAMRTLIREAAEAQSRRHEVLRAIVQELGLSVEQQTLTELIKRAPEPYARRLADLQNRLQGVLADSKNLARGNARVLRRSLTVVNECLSAVRGDEPAPAAYDSGGREGARHGAPSMLNRQG